MEKKEKTFIEELWEKKPELVREKVSKIVGIKKEHLVYRMLEDKKDYVRFAIIDKKNGIDDGRCVLVTDFKLIKVITSTPSDVIDEWVKFMYENCGKPYAMKYISRENQLYDSRRARDRKETDEKIEGMLNKMGYFNDNGYIK